MNTLEFISEIKKKYELRSDYAAAKLLKISTPTIYNYKRGKSQFDDTVAMKAAELLNLDPGYVLACVYAERTHNKKIASIWKKAAERLRNTAAGVIVISIAWLGAPAPESHATTQGADNIHCEVI